jgi:hypothetical protein
MSSTNLAARALVLVGLVAALSLPITAHAQAVTPERALLNQWPAIPSGPATAFTRVQAPTTGQPVLIDGERALLNRSHTVVFTVESATPVVATASVDGVKALLNRSSP